MKTVVVTGSTRGIGRGLAENFLARGCKVVISGRGQAAVDQTCQELGATYGQDNVAGKACDISNEEQIQGLWDHAANSFGVVDVWINNAGISITRAPIWEQSASDLTSIIATNLAGILLTNKIVIGEMLKHDHGQIWNMEGFGSNGQTAPGMTAYGATKRAVTYICNSLKKEVKDTSVQVCRLSPGIVVTDLLVGDYDLSSPEWKKTKKILNILGDKVETVTPFLVDGVLKADKNGASVAWLTGFKAFTRFMGAGFNKRDLFVEIEAKKQLAVNS